MDHQLESFVRAGFNRVHLYSIECWSSYHWEAPLVLVADYEHYFPEITWAFSHYGNLSKRKEAGVANPGLTQHYCFYTWSKQ